MKRSRVVAAVVALVVVVGVVAFVVGTRSGSSPSADPRRAVAEGVQVTAPDGSESTATAGGSTSGRATAACPATSPRFVPRRIDVQGVARGIRVITPPRDANGVPGVPPLTDTGKRIFAFDRAQGIEPGDRRGNVLLNAHTYPDSSALGNDLLLKVARGDRITLRGAGSQRLCYTVRTVTQVPADEGLPAYYSRTGRPQIAIVVCSGARLGPGRWESRTIFYASPGA